MNENLKEIKLDSSNIDSSIFVNEEFTYIYAKFNGKYENGSKGNNDGLYIYSQITSVYFRFDTIAVIIIDLSDLDYEKGNTLLKAINFFEEIGRDVEEKNKKLIVIPSSQNYEQIKSLIDMVKNNNIILDKDLKSALSTAKKEIKKYFS